MKRAACLLAPSMRDFCKFVVTGRYYNSDRRFSDTYSNARIALGINLWNGRVWGVLPNGKRKLLKHVVN